MVTVRLAKLLAITLSVCMLASIVIGCASGDPVPSTEETTTTAAPTPTPEPTSTPTPTPEPTATPTSTPTPPVTNWKSDSKVIGKWNVNKQNVTITYEFKKNNVGVVKTTYTVTDMNTNKTTQKTSETEFKYSCLGKTKVRKQNGKKTQFYKIRIVFNDNNYKDYEYTVSGKKLIMMEGATKMTYNKK